MKKITNLGNVNLTDLFTYDIISEPSFVEAKVVITKETRSQIRMRKINNIFNERL